MEAKTECIFIGDFVTTTDQFLSSQTEWRKKSEELFGTRDLLPIPSCELLDAFQTEHLKFLIPNKHVMWATYKKGVQLSIPNPAMTTYCFKCQEPVTFPCLERVKIMTNIGFLYIEHENVIYKKYEILHVSCTKCTEKLESQKD